MNRKSISPETAKSLSTFIVAIIFMTIIFTFSAHFTKKRLKDAENQYFSNIETILDGYSNIVLLQLQDYFDSLSPYYIPDIYDSGDVVQIHEFLKRFDYKIHEDFDAIYYLHPDGSAHFSDGRDIQMNIENHPCLTGDKQYYTSDLKYIEKTKLNYFFIEQGIYDENNKLLGVLGASINLEKFIDEILGIKLGVKDSFMLIDSRGQFLVHKRKDVIGKVYIPDNPDDIEGSSIYIAENAPKRILTNDDAGNKTYVMTKRLEDDGWVLAIKIPLSDIEQVYKPHMKDIYLLLASTILILIALIIVEAKVIDLFHKKQMIDSVYDPLTNFLTKQRFETEANRMLRHNPRSKFMLIESDIRGFKFINQNYGEEKADELLKFYSTLISKNVSSHRSIIGRGFADHFCVLIRIDSVHRAMSDFKESITKIYDEISSYEIPFFPKFGVSFLMPGDLAKGTTIQSLIGQATFAKNTIKDNMLTQYSVYNSRLLEKINEERFIESHMQQALENKEFFVMYQPKISLVDERIVGAEALVRWNSPKLGLMTPDKFIPLFERNGFITKLDFYVYNETFKFIQQQLQRGEPVVPISVNMSRNHNKPEKFIHDFVELFNQYSIPANLVQVEIIERSVMDSNTLREITNYLHNEGFTVAMDDFGSGESSLNMLTKIPVDVLKFDREFLNSSTTENGDIDTKSAKFIQTLIDLSKNLDKKTVFEGVETQSQRDFLRSVNCDQAQGYFYSRPLSEQDFIQFAKMHS